MLLWWQVLSLLEVIVLSAVLFPTVTLKWELLPV